MPVPLPSRPLLALLAAVAGLFLIDPGLALLGDAIILAAALLDARLAGSGLDATREVPSRLSLGETGHATICVSASGGRRPVRLRVTDDLPAGAERVGPDFGELAAPFGWTYAFRPRGRGAHVFGDIHVRVRGPLGLAWAQRRLARTDEVLVLPGLLEMRRQRLLGLRERLRRAGLRNTRQRGEGRSFESLRTYVPGDDPRTIDWKATAHRGTTMVREYEAERSQSVVLALDAGRMMGEQIGDRERLDHAMTAALLLGDVASLHGDRVGLFAFADQVLRFLPPRRAAMDRLARAMARIPTRAVEPNYPVAFNALRHRLSRRALVVVFTDVIDPGASHALLAQLSRSAARHLVVAVTLRSPELDAWAAAPVTDEAEAYRRAAAEEMIQARELALARMRGAGVQVVDTVPSQAVPALVNRYLEIKYRGRL